LYVYFLNSTTVGLLIMEDDKFVDTIGFWGRRCRCKELKRCFNKTTSLRFVESGTRHKRLESETSISLSVPACDPKIRVNVKPRPRTLAPKIPPVELHDDSKMTMLFKQRQSRSSLSSLSCRAKTSESESAMHHRGDEPALGKHTG
jgi:hypothetical protein